MKLLILTALLTATLTAQAGPVYNINTHTERSLPPWRSNALPKQRQGAAEGWREVVPFVAPTGMVAVASTRRIVVVEDEAREMMHTITEAEYAAAVQAETYAQLQAFIDSPADPDTPQLGTNGAQIRKIEGMIDWFIAQGCPLTRPIIPDVATHMINAWIEAQENAENWALTSKGNRYGVSLLSASSEIEKRGLSIDQVNAAWKYMVATGQNVEPQ